MKKVVVIGSGIGGLSCAYVLVKNGYEVTVLEQGIQTGGCLQCFYRDGAKFETGMHFIGSAAPGQYMEGVMRYFGLLDDVTLDSLDVEAYHTVRIAGDEFRFANGREAFIEQMSGYFPRERDALKKYVDVIDRISEVSSIRTMAEGCGESRILAQYRMVSINSVLDAIFSDRTLKNVLVGDLPLYAAVMDRTPFSQHAFVMDYYNRSAFRVVGGSDRIAASLVNGIRSMGGEILTRKKAVRIVCDDMTAQGVITEDDEMFSADYVISAVHPKRTLEMIDGGVLRPAFRDRVNSIPQTASCFAVYVKFKPGTMPYMNTNLFSYSDIPWGCEEYGEDEWPKSYLYMDMCHEPHPRWAKNGVVLAYMKPEEVAGWKGTRIGQRGEDYEEFKRLRAERLIAAVERDKVGFASSIESYDTSTPLTYADYTGTEDGSMYGVLQDVTLGAGGRVPYRTRIPNLFLAGQNVNSHGFSGVILASVLACSGLVSPEALCKQMICREF